MTSSNNSYASSYLILGGARSGKSRYAENLAAQSGKKVVYIATAKVLDNEMEKRVSLHKNDRPSNWTTVEEPLLLAATLEEYSQKDNIILVDCLTMWLTNLLTEDDSSLLKEQIDQLYSSLAKLSGDVIFVSNEISMGIIPLGELTRKYVDEAGYLHQQLAQQVNTVTLIVAGLPHTLKSDK